MGSIFKITGNKHEINSSAYCNLISKNDIEAAKKLIMFYKFLQIANNECVVCKMHTIQERILELKTIYPKRNLEEDENYLRRICGMVNSEIINEYGNLQYSIVTKK